MDRPDIPATLESYFAEARIALALASTADDHPLTLVNHRFCTLTGYDPDDVIGRNCRLLQKDADNREAREKINAFLGDASARSVRTSLINFRKDGQPFVNLLYMSKLRDIGGSVRFIFASQYDISRSQPEKLAAYDEELAATLAEVQPALAESGVVVEGSLMTIANTAATVAQAKLTLSDLDGTAFP